MCESNIVACGHFKLFTGVSVCDTSHSILPRDID